MRVDKAFLQCPSGGRKFWDEFWSHPPGTRITMRTDPKRVSISFENPDGSDGCWIRKDELANVLRGHYDISQLVAVRGRASIHLTSAEKYSAEVAERNRQSYIHPAKQAINEALKQARQSYNQRQKESAMSQALTNLITDNKAAAKQAAYNEAGRLALKKIIQIAGKKAPLMVRGYIDTPLGALLAANLASVAAAQLRPQDATLKKLTASMTVMAYQSALADLDIEGMIDEMLGGEVKDALAKAGEA